MLGFVIWDMTLCDVIVDREIVRLSGEVREEFNVSQGEGKGEREREKGGKKHQKKLYESLGY